MNIILIGFMGAGKTTVGYRLALRLGYRFLDMDRHLERVHGLKVAEIFARYGEAHFRQQETALLQKLVGHNNLVISTGGGAAASDQNLQLMKQIGSLVYLQAPAETIFERVSRDKSRPLLQVDNPWETLVNLLQKREPYYTQADLTIDINGQSPHSIASSIIKSL